MCNLTSSRLFFLSFLFVFFSFSPCVFATNAPSAKSMVINDSQALKYNMTTFYINHVSLYATHYLPFIGNFQFQYPDGLAWGFYPASVSKRAHLCAEYGYSELIKRIPFWPALNLAITSFGYSNQLLFWINDYTNSIPGRLNRTPAFWFWANPSDETGKKGTWVWEITLSQLGMCSIPTEEAADEAVYAVINH